MLGRGGSEPQGEQDERRDGHGGRTVPRKYCRLSATLPRLIFLKELQIQISNLHLPMKKLTIMTTQFYTMILF